MLSSCRSHRQVVQQITTDSTSVSFSEVEKVVHIPGDTVAVNMQVQPDFKDNKDSKDSNSFIPQRQTIETKRTKVTIELTKSGEIKATAVSKELDEKVTVQEKTIRTSASSVIVTEQKESWFKRALNTAKTSFKTVVSTIVILAGLFAWFRFRGYIKASISKLTKNS
ncbi:MAG TPA: hypothetical protein DCR40_18035 [Prolixibacteraceae bacterium]|nr:hypothetical protein [Prolixibacteraceae bacterium]